MELADGAGPNANYWVDTGHQTSDFGQQDWDGSGEAKANTGSAAQNAMTFMISVSGTYTLRGGAREDGVALDSFRIDPNPVAGTGQSAIFGQDSLNYVNGAIAGRSGGMNRDFDNTTNNDAFIGHTRWKPATWDAVFGTPTIISNALVTQDSAAKHEHNASEVDGVFNPLGSTRHQTAYYRVKMTRTAGATWSGLSVYDFNNERIFFGVQDAPNPSRGVRNSSSAKEVSPTRSCPSWEALPTRWWRSWTSRMIASLSGSIPTSISRKAR